MVESKNISLRVNTYGRWRINKRELIMTYETAKRILDRVRDGYNYPLHIVNAALEMTGDLNE